MKKALIDALWHSPLYHWRRGRKQYALIQYAINLTIGMFVYFKWVKPRMDRLNDHLIESWVRPSSTAVDYDTLNGWGPDEKAEWFRRNGDHMDSHAPWLAL